MHAVIRTYSGKGANELFNLLETRTADVESVIRSVKTRNPRRHKDQSKSALVAHLTTLEVS